MFDFIKTVNVGVSTVAFLAHLAIPSTLAIMPSPESAEIQSLKQKVRQGDSPSILPYTRKRLVADHPQFLTSKGQPAFIAGYLGSTDYTESSITSTLSAAAPKTPRHWRESMAIHLHERTREILETPLPGGYTNGVALTIVYGNSPVFSTLSLSPRLCPSCSTWREPDPRTCRIKTPAGDRMDHLLVTADAEHEAAHILSSHLGLRKKRQQKFGSTPELEQIAEENFANTYQALRMIQIFGEEGEAFQKLQLLNMVKAAQAGDVSHWSVASLHNVFDYLGKHPEARTLPTAELPFLAATLMDPPTRTQLDALKKAAGTLGQTFGRMRGRNQQVHLYQHHAPNIGVEYQRYEAVLSHLNPNRPDSFTPEEALSTTPTLTPDKISALEALNQGKRHPSCPSVTETLRPK